MAQIATLQELIRLLGHETSPQSESGILILHEKCILGAFDGYLIFFVHRSVSETFEMVLSKCSSTDASLTCREVKKPPCFTVSTLTRNSMEERSFRQVQGGSPSEQLGPSLPSGSAEGAK